MKSLRCRLGWHHYQCVKDTGKHAYEVCQRCQKRRIRVVYAGGYQPIDRRWLETGEWAVMRPPPGARSGVQSPDDIGAGDSIETFQYDGRWFYRVRLANGRPGHDSSLDAFSDGSKSGYATREKAYAAGKAWLDGYRQRQQEYDESRHIDPA